MTDVPEVPDTPESASQYDWLTDTQMEIVHYIERYHSSVGDVPNDIQLKQRFNVTDDFIAKLKTHPLVIKSLRYRGINYPSPGENLTDRQMHAIAAMTNYIDRRSDEKKLRDMGISAREWAQWQLDENFLAHLNERAERMLTASQHVAHTGLIKGMRNGNVASVKLYNEMVGRYDANQENNLNVRLLLGTFISILQRHIKDPVAMHAIATEMMNAAAQHQIENGNNRGGLPGRYAPPVQSDQRVIQMKGEI